MAVKLFKRKQNNEKYYSYKTIDETEALYRVIIGQRSNGKTYGFLKKVVEAYFEEELPSAYIRRYGEEIKLRNIGDLFNPLMEYIVELSGGKYNSVLYQSFKFIPCYRDEDGKIVSKAKIPLMYTVALNTAINAKGEDRGQLAYICYDEFLTRTHYLTDEFVLFMNMISTLIRDRGIKAIYLLGNTVNKYAPYFREFGIDNIEKMKQGEVYVYTYNERELTLAVEYAATAEATKKVEKYYAFENEQLKMIKSGEFEVASYPRFDRIQFTTNKDTLVKSFLINFNQQQIVGEIHKKGIEVILLFHPLGGPENLKRWGEWDPYLNDYIWNDKQIVFTDGPVFSILHQNSIVKGDTKVHQWIRKLIGEGHCYFSDNTTGEIVRNFMLSSKAMERMHLK